MADGFAGSVPLYLLIAGVVVVLLLARRFRLVGQIVSFALMVGGIGLAVMLIGERGRFDPAFARVAKFLHLDQDQAVVGKETRIPMASDGHFWVAVKFGQVERRMLVDSGATVTALSTETASAAGIEAANSPFPMIIQTANGSIRAQTATVPELRIGNIVARDLPIVTSPAFGDMDVVGMNFLSRLKSWRVEGRTLILTPNHPQSAS
ncbi:retropepsin-like aspartic protease family protein [Sphingomonas sp.]|jgi:aspartyl protease family protein|uniref:retropepsin-like aspartic protease family protein n=1 Tax=Sphingomonas sp. TaxID=28214 RepID=UPI002E307600|nr:TIGR02281 family clan AA aspartic protease [Sphingomonas sp.]HEX4693260.1 TIGR02281 family clan AA aspartic protease [Sphingomonas sp.]